MKCLIAVDGSQSSLQAARVAGMLLSSDTDQIVFYSSPPSIRVRSEAAMEPPVIGRARQALADSVFTLATEQLPPSLRERVERVTGEQAPAQGILAAADRCRADLVVLGARGHGQVKSLLVGSTSLHVAAHAKIPVLVVRGHVPHNGSAVRALLACTSAAHGRTHSSFLSRIHWPAGSQGRALIVVETPFGGELPHWLQTAAHSPQADQLAQVWIVEHERQLATQRAELAGLCRDLPQPFTCGESVIVEGHPAEQITVTADATMTDLIILGSHQQSSVTLALLGSTAFKVLTHAQCSVLLLPQDTATETQGAIEKQQSAQLIAAHS